MIPDSKFQTKKNVILLFTTCPPVAVHGLTDQEKAEFLTPSGPAGCMNQVSLEQARPNRQGRPQIRISSNGIPPLAPGDFWEEVSSS